MEEIGEVVHFYDKIGVAVLDLKKPLRVGDKISFKNAAGDTLFEQDVTSMQIEHQNIEEAKAGDMIGLKTDQKVHKGNKVYKL